MNSQASPRRLHFVCVSVYNIVVSYVQHQERLHVGGGGRDPQGEPVGIQVDRSAMALLWSSHIRLLKIFTISSLFLFN
jgi:hypothetical protein